MTDRFFEFDSSSPLSLPLIRSVNHRARSAEGLREAFRTRSPYVYQRFGNPTVAKAEAVLAALEQGERAVLFASGMAAISTVLLSLITHSGSHVVAQRDLFGQTTRFLLEILSPFGVEFTFVEHPNGDSVAAAMRERTRVVYVETPSNPALSLADIEGIAAAAHRQNVPLVVDGTFGGPLIQQPLALGADIVVHSATKFLNGHGDVMCGVAVGPEALMATVADRRMLTGGVLDPEGAWLLLRGLKTLSLRVERQCATALTVATFLSSHPAVAEVRYPYLPGSPDHALALKQMRAGGGVVSFRLRGGVPAARHMLNQLRLIPIATSLGGVDTIIEIPFDLDFGDDEVGPGVHPDARNGLIRLSVGLEAADQLIGDLEQALAPVPT